jgi:hypothetical protein
MQSGLLFEHTFRFLKQALGWTRPRLRDPAAADRWTWLILAACTQLWIARGIAADLRLPWQRPAPAGRLTPARVRRGFRAIHGTLPALTAAPKPGRCIRGMHISTAARAASSGRSWQVADEGTVGEGADEADERWVVPVAHGGDGTAGGAVGDDHLAPADDEADVPGMVRRGSGAGVEEHQVAGLFMAFGYVRLEGPHAEGGAGQDDADAAVGGVDEA